MGKSLLEKAGMRRTWLADFLAAAVPIAPFVLLGVGRHGPPDAAFFAR